MARGYSRPLAAHPPTRITRRPPRPQPRPSRARRTPPSVHPDRASSDSHSAIWATSPATGPPQVTSQRATRPASAAGWPSHRLTARPDLDGELGGGGRSAPDPHRHAQAGHLAPARGQRQAALVGGVEGDPEGGVLRRALGVARTEPGDQPTRGHVRQRRQLCHQHLVGDEPDAGHQWADGDALGDRGTPHRGPERPTAPGGPDGPRARGGRIRRPRRGRAPRPAGPRRGRRRRRETSAASPRPAWGLHLFRGPSLRRPPEVAVRAGQRGPARRSSLALSWRLPWRARTAAPMAPARSPRAATARPTGGRLAPPSTISSNA